MANYNIIYRMPFSDALGANWRVDFLQKDGVIAADPLILLGADSPLKLDKKNNEEDRFVGIIETTATISYVYRGSSDPVPETFINIEDDEYLIEVYKGDRLKWKGFLNADNNTYSWVPAPFVFSVSATDFTFMDSTVVDLNDATLFLYDYVTLGDFLSRALFTATVYDNPSLKILYVNKPAVIGAGLITDSLYIHTDAAYSFTDGVEFCTDVLKKLLDSIGARLFYADGTYWLQHQTDIGSSPQEIITITPDDTDGTTSTNIDISAVMGNGAGADVVYLNTTQEILINKALKQQSFNYELKPINQIKNFDWRTDTQAPFDDWEGGVTGFFERVGTGSAEDPFRLHIPDFTGSGQPEIWSRIPVKVGQRVEVTFRSRSFLTLPAPDTNSYEVYTKAIVLLVEAGTIGGLQQRYLAQGGEWSTGSGSGGGSGEAEYYHVSSRPVNGTDDGSEGTINIVSDSIPSLPGISDYEILVIILDSGITPAPPSGSTYYTELYPIQAGIYNNVYVKVTEKIVNTSKYSNVKDDEDLFFLDNQDAGYSNTIFYSDGGVMTPLPAANWNGKTIDETVVRMRVDEEAYPYVTVLGDFTSNTLEFHQSIILADKDNKQMIQIRDSYEVKSAKHTLMCAEIIPPGTAIATYTKTLLTEE